MQEIEIGAVRMTETLSNIDLAIRKIEGVLTMVRIGNANCFEFCNMKATEKKLEEVLNLLKEENK